MCKRCVLLNGVRTCATSSLRDAGERPEIGWLGEPRVVPPFSTCNNLTGGWTEGALRESRLLQVAVRLEVARTSNCEDQFGSRRDVKQW